LTNAPRKPSASLQLARGELRILHGKRGKPLKTIGPFTDLLGQIVVGLAGDVVRARRIGDGLNGGSIERENHHLQAVLVHLAQAALVDVEHAGAQLGPGLVGQIPARVV
jgi:hypothetical protein